MTTITRAQFVSSLEEKVVDVDRLRETPEGARLAAADQNRDGKISGTGERKELFRLVDTLDKNGSTRSVDTSNMRVDEAHTAIQAASARPRRGLKPISRDEMREFFEDATLTTDSIAGVARRTGDRRLVREIRRADLDGDGKIGGRAEADRLFTAIDRRDRDGSTETVALRRNGDVDALVGEAERAQSPVDRRSPASTLVEPSAFARRYQGAGAVKVAAGRGRDVGAFQFTGGMNVDTDGGRSALARSDKYWQAETSMQWRGGKSLDADSLPFVVLPPSLAKATGAKLGDLVEVRQGDKLAYAIYGDVGPQLKLGEGSLALSKFFDGNAGPNRAVRGDVTYTVLPGSGREQGIHSGASPKSWDDIQAAGRRAFAAAHEQGLVRAP